MKKTLTVAALLLSIVSLSIGQSSQKAKAKMVRTPFAGGDAVHAIQEVALDFREHATDPGDRVAVRVCSKKKMLEALLQAAASPFVLQEYLEHYGFNARRILFLRSEDCLASDPSIVVTEFWLIPNGAAPPPSVESITAEEANGQQDQRPIDCETFQAHLDHAIIDWRKLNGTHFIVIVRLGTGERDRKLNRARLYYVEDYLQRKDVQYVFAEGSRVDGLGRFEVYVGGRLAMSVALKRGSNRLCFGNTG